MTMTIRGEPRWYRLDGHTAVPCASIEEWAQHHDVVGRIVKQEDMGPFFVSTVFLGIDHRFGPGDPLLFETMIFRGHGSGNDVYQTRCSTWEQAEAMHANAVSRIDGTTVKVD